MKYLMAAPLVEMLDAAKADHAHITRKYKNAYFCALNPVD
jgi:hypothetical protein